jgi:alpha-galactosidase
MNTSLFRFVGAVCSYPACLPGPSARPLAAWSLSGSLWAAETVWLGSLDLKHVRQGWGQPQPDKSVTGKPLSIGGRTFERGLGTHRSTLWVDLGGGAERFQASVGVDDAATSDRAGVVFQVAGDSARLWESGLMRRGQAAKSRRWTCAGSRT